MDMSQRRKDKILAKLYLARSEGETIIRETTGKTWVITYGVLRITDLIKTNRR